MTEAGKTWIIGGLCLLLGIAGTLLYSGQTGTAGSVEEGGMDRDRVAGIVRQVISENPELIVESLQSMQKRAYEEQMAQAAEGLKTHMKDLKEDADSPHAGPADAPITIVEFFDYHCGYCKRMTPVLQKLLKEHKDIKIVFKEYPILSADSQLAARASLAFSKLAADKYFDFHTSLIGHSGQYTQENLNAYAGKLGVSADALQAEMQEEWVARELKQTADLAEKLGVQGTPALIIGEELVPGAMDYASLEFRIKALKSMKDDTAEKTE